MAKKEVVKDLSKKIRLGLDEIMSDRFGRYSKYIIQERALPDGRDGLKPVQRRILYAMNQDGNTYEKPHRKSAKAVGYIIGYYHPHGDTSVYDAIVRLSQDFKMNMPLIEMQGNNGSIDDDPPAAMRYTESRLAKISQELLVDIDKECVNFTNNYDDTMMEPTVLPVRFPLLLVNGSTGIASGYATNIAPHNLNEVIDATAYRISNPDCTIDDLMHYIKGPDFPTGGIVQGKENIKEVFTKGKGKVVLRSKCEIVTTKTNKQIVVTEIPYEVVKINLVKKIDDIRLNNEIDGISDVRDESGRDGLKIVIDIKKEQDPELILNYLYKNTDLQVNYNYNMIAIINHRPVLMNLITAIDSFISFRKETILKRTNFLLNKKKSRMHIIEGLIKAISILDDVIEIIRRSNDKQDAKKRLIEAYLFTDQQAEAIVNLRLYRLSNTDIKVLKEEFAALVKEINDLKAIINSEVVLNNLIIKDLNEIKDNYGYERRTIIEDEITEINIDKEAMIINEPCVVSVSKDGYIKRMSLRSFSANSDTLPTFKEGDSLIGFKEVETLDTLLLFTTKGNYIYLPVYKIDECRFKDLGKHYTSYAKSEDDERIVSCVVVRNFDTYAFITMVSKKGMIKRTLIKDFKVSRYSKSLKAMSLSGDDELVKAKISFDNNDIIIFSANGYYNRYNSNIVTYSMPKARGIKAISLKDDYVSDFIIVNDLDDNILIVNDSGQMKRVKLDEFELTSRATKGLRTFKALKSKDMYITNTFNTKPYDNITINDGELKKITASGIAIMSNDATFSTPLEIKKPFFILDATCGITIAPIIDYPSNFFSDDNEVVAINLFEGE